MAAWWERNIVEPGKLPLLLLFASFVVTFIVTRTITRLIRAGRGPFRDNVRPGGVHVHHAVPGLVALVVGAVLSVAARDATIWRLLAAVLIGIGTSLVLDEFALILHLRDVYWTDEGRESVEMVSLTVACLGFLLVGAVPFGVEGVDDAELGARIGTVLTLLVNAALLWVCVAKGKPRLALFGVFLPTVAIVGAIRLARPGSRWARRRYGEAKLARAVARATRFDRRWDPLLGRLSDLIAGSPSRPG